MTRKKNTAANKRQSLYGAQNKSGNQNEEYTEIELNQNESNSLDELNNSVAFIGA